MVHSPFTLLTSTLCPGADITWRHCRLPLPTKSPTYVQNCTVEFFKKNRITAKGQQFCFWRAKPTLTLTGKQWTFPWLRGHGDMLRSTHSGRFLRPFCKVSLSLWASPGEGAPPWEAPLTPTTKLLFKMGETRCNSHHRKCPKILNFKRTVHFLCHLKLMAAAITPASNAHSTAPRKTIPSRRAVQSTAYLWQPSDTGVPLP